ncbi:transcriptional regulator [Xenorhabdus beddingii]|uniref:Transcriptional regulator n=1 Tax=Xenorhabdus beddingii TaxID=40578 RepID=A0A1Y2S726_9GAMM|nr:hypothetical protein [Xenorhabdus beddingii]OTA14448.1 transcriptional regulator [Xenorhabdus beddingii]
MNVMEIRITEECKRLGLSQADFESLTGYSCNTQTSYEHNKIPLGGLCLHKLAEHGFDTMYIITGNRVQSMSISIEEQEIIENYRAMNQASRLNIQTASHAVVYKRHNESIRVQISTDL